MLLLIRVQADLQRIAWKWLSNGMEVLLLAYQPYNVD